MQLKDKLFQMKKDKVIMIGKRMVNTPSNRMVANKIYMYFIISV